MKKLTALLLTLMLLLGCVSALAETATETAWMTLEFDDFTIEIPEDIAGETADSIEDGAVFMILYPNYDENASFATNINFVWSSAVQDLSAVDAATVGQQIMTTAYAQYNEYGITTANETLVSAAMDEVGGKPALSLMYSADCDYTALGGTQLTLYTVQAIVSDAAFGTYTITVSIPADYINDADMMTLIEQITNSIQWKN